MVKIKKRSYNKYNLISRYHELVLSNMELRNKIKSLESELRSLKANIKNDIDNVKYIMNENTKVFNKHTHVQTNDNRTFETEIPMQLIK
mgnify:CR=1 FL=1